MACCDGVLNTASRSDHTHAGSSQSLNPLQAALLRWYPANMVTTFSLTSGYGPRGIAFDGANIWVADYNTGPFSTGNAYVTKLSAVTGATIGNYSVGLGGFGFPSSVAFDGANIWVTVSGEDCVAKLNSATGAQINCYPVGAIPDGVAFDGTYIWAANSASSSVTKFNAATGATVGTYTVGSVPSGLAFDGANIWVTNLSSDTLSKL